MRPRHLLPALAAMFSVAAGPGAARVEPFDPFGAAGVDPHPGAAVPLDAALRDAAGRPVTLRALAAGRPLVIAPVQHRCPNICGLTLEGLKAAIAGQAYRPGRDFEVVALGLDPREGPDAAALSQQRLGGGPGIAAVVGDAAAVGAATRAMGYRYAWDPRIGQYAHIAAVAVVTPQGRLSHWLYGVAPTPANLHLALTDAASGRLGGLGDQIRLLCYHFDPRNGRYDSLVMTLARWLGGLTTAGLVLLVAALVLRDRRRGRPA
jgi:protein SCO1/2